MGIQASSTVSRALPDLTFLATFSSVTKVTKEEIVPERRFESRLNEVLGQVHVSPDLLRGVLPRLEEFVEPFVEHPSGPEHRRRAAEYVTGLMSKLERKTGEGIAYLHDQQRQGIQKFIGEVPWDHQPMLRTLAGQVGQELGEPDGVVVFDRSGFLEERDQVGGCRQAVVWPARQGRQLPGGCLRGVTG